MPDGTQFTAEDLAALASEAPAVEAVKEPAAVEAVVGAGASQEGAAKAQETAKEPAKGDDGKPAAKTPTAKTGTLLDDEGGQGDDDPAKTGEKPEGEKPAEEKRPEGDPADWRKGFADKLLAKLKGQVPDDKIDARRKSILNRLNRYKSAEDYMIAGFAAQERIASGEMRAKLPEDASEEERAAWRAENGIPDKANAYDVPKIAGYKWTDADKPLIDAFKEIAHVKNYTQDQVNGAAEWYVQSVQKQAEEWQEKLAQTDSQDRTVTRDALRAEWGPQDYRPKVALIDRLLADDTVLSEGLGDYILNARYTDKDGASRRLINAAPFARMLGQYAEDTYGNASFVPGGKSAPGPQSVIEEAEKIMKEDLDRYYREGWDQKMLVAMQDEEKLATKRSRRVA